MRTDYARRPAEHDSGFHFRRHPVSNVRFELPLVERIGDGFRLIGKCAEKMDVLYFSFLVDDDSHRDRIESGSVKIGSTREITFTTGDSP